MSDDQLIERIAAELRRPHRTSPEVDARVMAAVRALPRHRAGRRTAVWSWLTRARTIRITPLGAFAAAAAAIVAAVFVVPRLNVSPAPAPSSATAPVPPRAADAAPADSLRVVQFVFVAPTAHSVSLVGDFNNWELGATPLAAGPSRSVWTVRLRLPDGRHRYAFVVDDSTWAADPAAPPAAGDDFGVPSSVVTVTGGGSSS